VRAAIGDGAAVLMYAFYAALLELSAQHRRWLLATSANFWAAYAPFVHFVLGRLDGDILRALDAANDGELEDDQLRAGFAGAMAFPRRGLWFSVLTWGLAALVVPAILKLRFSDVPWSAFLTILLGTMAGGVVAAIFTFLADKQMVQPLRDALAARIADPGERQRLVQRFGIAPKLRYAMTGVILVTVALAVLLARSVSYRPIEGFATHVKLRYLERVVGRVDGPSDAAFRLVRLDAEELGIAEEIVLLDRRTGAVVGGSADMLTPSEVSWVRGGSGDGATSRGLHSANAFAWLPLEDAPDLVLVAATPEASLRGAQAHIDAIFALLGLLAAAVGCGAAHYLARDLSRLVERLRGEAERIASGDLTPGDPVESEDELGDLGRAFERMSSSLRATVGRVAEAAEGVDRAAAQLGAVGGTVVEAAAGQREALEQTTTSMAAVNSRIAGITESAQLLSGNVEEASSSVLELGAAGEQLNTTASSLSGEIEGVSASIEQMIHSVSRIGGNAESLASAAGETSSSMTEMAASMRDVEENASETARLSSQVVELADGGRERVQKTIAGMEAIRDATDAADAVIRGLGTRVQEIGAIVDVIDDVADETSLLALNAAIIAAQAGDQGRAFSVVADEITELADRVLNSTKEIAGLIRAVQEESANAVGAIEDGSRSVQEGVDLSAGAGLSLEEITTAARASGDRIQEIVHAVREQSRAANHVSELMVRVSRGVGDIQTAGSEQQRGNELIRNGTGAMRDVSQQVHRTTEEQARGASRIRHSMESVRDAVDTIHVSLREQSGACREAVSHLESVYERTRSHEESGALLREATDGLRRQAEALREDVLRFRI